MTVIRELSEIVNYYELDSEVLAASIRHPRHVTESALAGAHVATVPFKVFQQMVRHPLTDKGIVQFKSDWENARAELAAKTGRRAREGRRGGDNPGGGPASACPGCWPAGRPRVVASRVHDTKIAPMSASSARRIRVRRSTSPRRATANA